MKRVVQIVALRNSRGVQINIRAEVVSDKRDPGDWLTADEVGEIADTLRDRLADVVANDLPYAKWWRHHIAVR